MPSGPKKRKAAKKKIESSAVSTTIPEGNGVSGSEATSPMSAEHGDRLDEKKDGDGSGGGDDGLSGGTVSSGDGVGRAVDEHQVIPQKAEEALPVPERGAVVPISQPEDVSVEHVEASKAVVGSISGEEIMIPAKKVVSEEKSEGSVPGATAVHPPPIPTAVGKGVGAQVGDVAVEKVENLSLRQPSPSEEREVKVEAEEQSARQEEAESGMHHFQRESRDVGTEVVCSPQAAQRTSWLSCCGLFDALTRSSR